MRTHLPQNQFITNSVAQPPGSVAADTAAAPPQPPGAAAGPIDEPSTAMEVPQRAPAGRAPNTATTPGAFGVIDCIHEIFHYARKLMKDDPGFVLDEREFMDAIDETPLFIREDGYLRRNA